MLFFKKSLHEGALIGVWKIEESLTQLKQMLHEEDWYKPFLEKMTFEDRKKEWLSVRVLLKTLCGEEKEIAYNESGKPFLKDGSYHISISHTRGFVALLLDSYRSVGIDVERISERVLRVLPKFLNEEERNLLLNNQVVAATLFWSAKESVFKMLATGAVDFKDHFHIDSFCLQEEGSFNLKESRTKEAQLLCIYYQVFHDFVLTWTCENKQIL